jgi:hypothetical protein
LLLPSSSAASGKQEIFWIAQLSPMPHKTGVPRHIPSLAFAPL